MGSKQKDFNFGVQNDGQIEIWNGAYKNNLNI
jgi:hypothetical protein